MKNNNQKKDFQGTSDRDLTEIYLHLYNTKKNIELELDELKTILIQRHIETQIFLETAQKIYISDGNKKTVYNVKSIFKKCEQENLVCHILKVMNINKTGLDSITQKHIRAKIESIINQYATTIESDKKIISVRKLTKSELKEAQNINTQE